MSSKKFGVPYVAICYLIFFILFRAVWNLSITNWGDVLTGVALFVSITNTCFWMIDNWKEEKKRRGR